MDFFAAQERSKRTSRYLLLAFFGAFAAIAIATSLVVGAAFGWYSEGFAAPDASGSIGSFLIANSRALLTVAAGVLGIMIVASLIRSGTLSRGGGQVARMLGANEVNPDDRDPLHRRLINVVEEMAIASGLPVPEIYVLEHESGINAFAAGLTHSDAAVAVTRGALERLNRAELSGVIAHEFSHVLNGDMRLNQRLIGFSYGILVLSIMGRWVLRSARFGFGRRSRNSGTAIALGVGLALTVVGAIGVFLSRLIKAAVSRQRESLADASAVQFTREPSALAGALKKIGGYTGKLSAVDDEEVAHMLFENRAGFLAGLLATHPPLVDRIRTLDPQFEPGDYIAADSYALETAEQAEGVSALAGAAPASLEAVLERTGSVDAPGVGTAVRRAFPATLYDAAHSRDSSFLLVLALALSPDDAIAGRQAALLRRQLGDRRAALTQRLRGELDGLDRRFWLGLLELAMPMVKQRPPEQLEYLFDVVRELDRIDDHGRLFEYVLVRVLAAYLEQLPEPPVTTARTAAKQKPVDALASLLGAVAAYGHEDGTAAAAAYAAGAASLDAKLRLPPFDGHEAARDLARLDAALARLAQLKPSAKRKVLESLLVTIRHDSRVETAEVELFRAIAATLGCPSPPQLGAAVGDA